METRNFSRNTSLDVDEDFVAWNINLKESLYYIPAGVFVIILAVLGIPGNFLVLYVYTYHFKVTTANILIRFLAILDAVCCLFGMTYEIVDMFFPYLNGESYSCKIFRTIEQSTEFISGEVLFLISYDRFLHVCKPFRIWDIRKARKLIIAAVVVGVITSWPTLLTMGKTEEEINGITVYACSRDPMLENTLYMFIYYLAVNSILGISFLIMVGQYICIWSAIYRWRRANVFQTSNVFFTSASRIQTNTTRHADDQTTDGTTDFNNTIRQRSSSTGLMHASLDLNLSNDNNISRRKIQVIRREAAIKPVITVFAVTSVFVLSYLPYFMLIMLESTGSVHPLEFSFRKRQIWELLFKSYFLSNMMNPFIYATFDYRFRQKCYDILFRKHYYERLCCRC